MDVVAILAGFAFSITCWALLVRSMKINGRPLWWRHLAASLWSPLSFAGGSLLIGSLIGVTDAEGDSWGFSGVISALTVLIPVFIALGVSWGAAKRKRLNTRTTDSHATPIPTPTPNPTPSPKAKPAPKSPANIKPDLPPGALRFTYEDFNGGITHRTVTNWKEEGAYIKGFCLDRRDNRTFRKERIIAFSDGEHLLRGINTIPTPTKPTINNKPMEILFTGFAKAKRAELEMQALDEGMIVRTRVTQALDFLCVGPKAAPSKQVEAEHRGATVLDEMAFYDLLESGELPDR
jgi:hypothetical protein